jgi:hypothetical protein
VHKETTGGERSLRTRELVMNPVFTALVSAWQFGWGDSDSGDGYGSYGSSYGGGTWT